MPRWLLVVGIVLATAPAAAAAEPSVTYAATIESPGSVARGLVAVRVAVSGGVSDADQAALHVRRYGSWVEEESVRMARVGEATFESQLSTLELPNGPYRLEVRVWGEVPPYDPGDARTFARAVLDVAVDNAPDAPQTLQAATPSPSVRLAWTAVPTADRADFFGYRVFRRAGDRPCPAGLGSYRAVADIQETLYEERVPPGRYCFRVAALHMSDVTGTISSTLSVPLRIEIVRGMAPVGGTAPQVELVPPPPPELGEGEVEVSDGSFVEDLPYGSHTQTDEVTDEGEQAAMAREAGVDPRRTPTLVASGLVLAVGALLLRRFLSGGMVT